MKKKILCFILVLSLLLPCFMVVASAMSVSGGAGTNQVYVEFYSDSSFTKRINSIKKGNYFYALLSMKDFSYFWGGDFKLGFNSNIARLEPEKIWWQELSGLTYIENDHYPVASNSSGSIEFTVIEENHRDGTGLHTISIGNTSVFALRFKAVQSGNFNLYLNPDKYLPKGYQCFTGLSVHDEIDINYKCTSLSVVGEEIPVSTVSINGTEQKLTVGSVRKLTAVCLPDNATDKSVEWSSSNPFVATVDANGKVAGKSVGKTVISARAKNGVRANYVITIEAKSSILNYDSYGYSFPNSASSFGYSWWYKIPKERYMQLGYEKSVAKKMVEEWGGNCYGMSVSSILFYKNVLQEERYNSVVHKPIDFDPPDAGDGAYLSDKWEVKLRHMLELFQASQKLETNLVYPIEKSSISRLITIVKDEIDKGNPVKLGIGGYKRKNNDEGSHGVVIYGYDESDIGTRLYIYDCAGFVDSALYTENSTDLAFHYTDDTYVWMVNDIMTYELILAHYNNIYENGNDATSLFSLNNKPSYMYMFRKAGDLTITNSSGQVSTITNGKVAGEIEDITITPSSYLAAEPRYTIKLPTDTYTIVGKGDEMAKTSFADDYMSADISVKSSTPITISSDLKEVSIDTAEGENYSTTYTTYDNIFDEMILSGTSSGSVSSKLVENNVIISGVDSLTASATVSDSMVTASSEELAGYDELTIKCEESENGATIQILNEDKELTEKADLPQRTQVEMPDYDLESGEYTEGQTLTFTKDDETIIYYTTDGSTPSADNGIVYSMPVEINKSMTIKAVATKYGYIDSDIITLEYTLPEISSPFTNYVSGEYDGVLSLEFMCDDAEGEIYYTLDGTDPYTNGVLYTVPINIFENTDVLAYTVRDGCVSEVSEHNYTINHKKPFYFENTALNQNNEIITLDNISELDAVSVSVKKLLDGEMSGNFFAAFYDEDKLIAVDKTYATISEENDIVTIDVTEDVSKANKMKLFVWNEGIMPLGEVKEQEIHSVATEE